MQQTMATVMVMVNMVQDKKIDFLLHAAAACHKLWIQLVLIRQMYTSHKTECVKDLKTYSIIGSGLSAIKSYII